MTAVTGLVDAFSFLSLGRVFTANMTGNIVLLAFATAHVSALSIARSLTALLASLVGVILGGRVMARASADSQIRFAAQVFLLEVAFLFAASFCGIGYRGDLLEACAQVLSVTTWKTRMSLTSATVSRPVQARSFCTSVSITLV
jgi:uncharacterized membrane protein YoaK (UPF0700 family)